MPLINVEGAWVLSAFRELSTCRQYSMSIGPIPWRDIVAYADRAGLALPTAELFQYVIRRLDSAWLAWERAEQKRRAKQEDKGRDKDK